MMQHLSRVIIAQVKFAYLITCTLRQWLKPGGHQSDAAAFTASYFGSS